MPSVSYEPYCGELAFIAHPVIGTSTPFVIEEIGAVEENFSLQEPERDTSIPDMVTSGKPQAKEFMDEDNSPSLGIDLGTTFSCVGVYKNEWVEIIPNEEGSRKTPFYVAFRDTECLLGDAAKDQAPMNTANTVYDLKRMLGRRFSDPQLQMDRLQWPFKVGPGPMEQPIIRIKFQGEEQQFSPEEVCAMLLGKMRAIAESFLGCPVTRCVIAVPSSFTIAQREATARAGALAGLRVMRVVNEPTAAALSYVLHKDSLIRQTEEKNIMIYDLGGGTVSVAVISVQGGGVLEVLAMAGDCHLGGTDFDRRLVSYFSGQFKQKHNKDISGNARALRKLETACERVKRSLSMTTKTTIDIDALFEGIDFYSTITREEFEQLNVDLFERCLDPVRRCLVDANVAPDDVSDIVLVGGCTRIPKVQQMLQELFGRKELSKNVNADEAVAFGAAMFDAILGRKESLQLHDILPLEVIPNSIGIETAGGQLTTIIKRNTHFPAWRDMEFVTFHNEQTCVFLNVYEGEEPRAVDNQLVGVYELMELPPAPREGLKVIVIVHIDASGHVSLEARLTSGERIKCVLRSPLSPLYPAVVHN